jgi:polyisoprenyl-phosphate glycosyltransferase
MSAPLKYSIVVPVFNAEKCLDELVLRIINTMNSITSEYEIILVDDYSSDKSWEIIKTHKRNYPKLIKGIRLAKNFGQHNATLCGFSHAIGELFITIDDDLENNPEDISKLIEKKNETNVVYGYGKKSDSFVKLILSRSVKKLSKLISGEKSTGSGSSFRLINRELGKKIIQHANRFSMIDEFLLWHTDEITEVKVVKNNSKKHKSGYTYASLTKFLFKTIFLSSSIPLRTIRNVCLLMIFFNFMWALVVLYKKIFHQISVDGYTSIIIAILFSSNLIALVLTIIAEYIRASLLMLYKKPCFHELEII